MALFFRRAEATLPVSKDAQKPATDDASWVGIVDDDPSLRIALARALRANGIRAETFESAEEFLGRSAGEPECIVLDIHLGGMSGIELRNQLTSQGSAPPIVFITGHDDVLSQSAEVHGACGFLRKPFDTSDLVALLRPHLRGALVE